MVSGVVVVVLDVSELKSYVKSRQSLKLKTYLGICADTSTPLWPENVPILVQIKQNGSFKMKISVNVLEVLHLRMLILPKCLLNI